VLEKKIGMQIYDQDVYVNVAGGIKIAEPAIDLALILSVASGLRNKPLKMDVAVFGEIGLTGEVRPVSRADVRIAEAVRCGFKNIVLPKRNAKDIKNIEGVNILGVAALSEALNIVF
jgi:DNA repair protein RadA/Sms